MPAEEAVRLTRREVQVGVMGDGGAVAGVAVKVHVSTFRGLEVAGLGVVAVFFIAWLVQIVLVGGIKGVLRRPVCALTFEMVAADMEAAANFLTHPVVLVGCPTAATTFSAKRRLIPTTVNVSSNN